MFLQHTKGNITLVCGNNIAALIPERGEQKNACGERCLRD
jgi:hypothetical protein